MIGTKHRLLGPRVRRLPRGGYPHARATAGSAPSLLVGRLAVLLSTLILLLHVTFSPARVWADGALPGATATMGYGQGGSFISNSVGVIATSLDDPSSVVVDGSGGLYVVDTNNNRVLHYPTGSTTADAVYGQGGSFTTRTGDNGGVSASSLSEPVGVAVDGSGGAAGRQHLARSRRVTLPPHSTPQKVPGGFLYFAVPHC